MIIAFSGCANSGKTTLIKKFLNNWPMYASPVETYRDALKEKNMGHSKNTSEETQMFILDYMISQVKKYKDEGIKNIVYDRCPLDVLAYTIQAFELGKVSEDFVSEIVEKVKEALSAYDIIFVLPFNPDISIEDNGRRETDIEYIKRTDTIFMNIMHQYYTNFDSNDLFPKDCPGIILLDSPDKMSDIRALINTDGQLYSPEEDQKLQEQFIGAISDAKNNKKMLEAVIQNQESLLPRVNVSKLKI